MKILQIIDSLRVGGAQKLLVVYSQEMLLRNHQVEVVTLDEHIWESAIKKDLEKLGVLIRNISVKNLGDFAAMIRLVRFIRSSKPDIIHCQLFYANIFGTFAGRISGIPCVASLHNATIYESNWYRLRIWLETQLLNWFSKRVIACGYTVATVQQPRFTKNLEIIPNPIPSLQKVNPKDVEFFRRSQLPGGKGILLVSVGRLIFEKGYPDLIQAMSLVAKQTKQDFKLLILGDGPLHDQLHKMISEKKLEKIISFLGQRDDVSKILSGGDIFISTSILEGQSIAVFEAMAAGVPVIVTDVGDNARIIPPDCGVLLPINRPDLVAEHTLRLMKDPNLRKQLVINTNQKVLKNLSSSIWADKLIALYNEVLHG